jgi:hypothetical protein
MHFDLIQSIRDSDYRYLVLPRKLKCACFAPSWTVLEGPNGCRWTFFYTLNFSHLKVMALIHFPTGRETFILIRLATSNLYTKVISSAGTKCYGVLLQRNFSVSRCTVFIWQLKTSCLLTQYPAYKDRPMQVNVLLHILLQPAAYERYVSLFIWYHIWRL